MLFRSVPGSLNGEQVQDSEQHDLEVTVRLDAANAAITATLEARSLYKWVGPIASLSQHAIWTTPPGILALGTMTAEWAVYEVKVKRLDVK